MTLHCHRAHPGWRRVAADCIIRAKLFVAVSSSQLDWVRLLVRKLPAGYYRANPNHAPEKSRSVSFLSHFVRNAHELRHFVVSCLRGNLLFQPLEDSWKICNSENLLAMRLGLNSEAIGKIVDVWQNSEISRKLNNGNP